MVLGGRRNLDNLPLQTLHQRKIFTLRVADHNVIVGGESYGQGSSREHAALCPMYLGVKAVLAKSIERIHRANLINFGIVPFTFVDPADYDKIDQGDKLELKGIRAAVEGDGRLVIKTKKGDIALQTTLSDREKHVILCGGLLASL